MKHNKGLLFPTLSRCFTLYETVFFPLFFLNKNQLDPEFNSYYSFFIGHYLNTKQFAFH